MPAHPRDDFSAFAGSEHMFFGLDDPFGFIREEIENGLRRQVPDTVVESIVARAEPKFLTLGRKVDDGSRVIVTHYGVCALLDIELTYGRTSRERLRAALTLAFGDVDQPGHERARSWTDLHDDADRAFDEATFQQRFLAFRYGTTGAGGQA